MVMSNEQTDANQFKSELFSPEKYVKDISINYVGGIELQLIRKTIQSLSDDTNNKLKKNVYQNYVQFIDTAKEISHLESEMYQLSHYLSEQKSLLSTLSLTSVLGSETSVIPELENKNIKKDIELENRQKLATILEKVEGCKELLEVPCRTYLYEGDLLELDPVENVSLKTVHVYLFTDGFMITNRNSKSHGLMKYVMEVMYDLGSLAVVNVRDLGNVKHAFKLLIFPDTRVFQCSSNSSKKEWLDKFDQAKKTRLAQDQQKRESIVDKSPTRSGVIDSPYNNPFDEKEDDQVVLHPEWFLDIPEELDVCVAQRHFEDALVLLQKAKDYISQYTAGKLDPTIIDIQRKVDQRHNYLTEVLMNELTVSPDKSLQGGLRAGRRAVRLLNQLGRSTQACDLFLKLCSTMLKTQCKRVKREGSTFMYVRHLSSVIFTNMCHITEEFLRAFPDSSICTSAYVVWISTELSSFTTHIIKQVFMPQTSLTTLADCVVLIRTQCERLCTYGVDLCYQLDDSLRIPLTRALRDAKDKVIESVKLRALEDKLTPTNLRTKSVLSKFLQEHSEVGLELNKYVTGDTWLQLTSNTLAFTKLFLKLLEDCLKIAKTDLVHVIDDILYDVFESQMKNIEFSLQNELQSDQKIIVGQNVEFLLNVLLELAMNKYMDTNDLECSSLKKIKTKYSHLLPVHTPTRSTKTKYSSEFL